MIKASTARDVTRLLGDLTDDSPRREAAVARLTIIGARAQGRLIEYLEQAPNAGARAAALRALDAIGDARAVEPASRWVGTRDQATALAALSVLRGHVGSAARVASGAAIDALTAIALDGDRDETIRLAAIEALWVLPARVVAPLAERLEQDRSPAVRRRATGELTAARVATAPGDALEAVATDLARVDPDKLRARLGRAHDTPIATLHRVVRALRAREAAVADPMDRARWTAARGAAHQALASRGSRVALYDLRETLEAAGGPLPVGFLAALHAVGDASCLEAVAGAHAKARAKDGGWWADQLLETFHEIVAREKLTRRHAAWRRVATRHPGLL